MTSSRGRLRAALTGIGAVLALATLVAGPASAQEDDIVPPGDWSQAQYDWMINWIDWNEQVLPDVYPTSFNDGGAQLEAMGYVNFGATAPGGYDHWINRDLVNDSHFLNPNHAESLVYRNTGGNTWELEAAMFFFVDGVMVHDLPSMLSWIPGWHGHPELCRNVDDGTFGGITDPDNPNCPPGTEQATTPVMVHAWITDPGCGHRFGGVGVGGLHCDVSHGDH